MGYCLYMMAWWDMFPNINAFLDLNGEDDFSRLTLAVLLQAVFDLYETYLKSLISSASSIEVGDVLYLISGRSLRSSLSLFLPFYDLSVLAVL
jgi:hypothetical protein